MCRCVRWKDSVRGIACVGVFTCAHARAHAADAIRCSRVEEREFYFRLADTSPGGGPIHNGLARLPSAWVTGMSIGDTHIKFTFLLFSLAGMSSPRKTKQHRVVLTTSCRF